MPVPCRSQPYLVIRRPSRRCFHLDRGTSDSNRRAKFYSVTRAGGKALKAETEDWERKPDRNFDQELEAHLAMAEDDHMRRGMTPAEARRAALVELGGLTQLREAARAARGLAWMGGSAWTSKLALRMLRRFWG